MFSVRLNAIYSLGLALISTVLASPMPTGLEERQAAPITQLSFKNKPMKYVLAFGDSYSYVQGTYGRPEYSFIGDAQNTVYNQTQLLSNEIKLNTTSSGGPNWLEYLTGCYQGRPRNCGVQLWDFAFTGAAVSSEFIKPAYSFTVPLVDQVKYFMQSANSVLNLPRDQTLVTFFIGLNDINSSFKSNVDFTVLYGKIIDRQFVEVQRLYDNGYRNFLFMGVPKRWDTQTNQTDIWNKILENRRWNFNNRLRSAGTYRYDTNYLFKLILRRPSSYGITEPSNWCKAYQQPDLSWNYASYGCKPMNQYFWNYNGHIGYRVHQIIAENVRNAIAAF